MVLHKSLLSEILTRHESTPAGPARHIKWQGHRSRFGGWRAIAKAAPGVPLKELDAAARDYIEAKGYGKYFGHGTGHGVGLDIHEAPGVSWRSTETAQEGMVFTIEPGIYLPGVGGVRIEDVVHITKTGRRILTRNIPKAAHII